MILEEKLGDSGMLTSRTQVRDEHINYRKSGINLNVRNDWNHLFLMGSYRSHFRRGDNTVTIFGKYNLLLPCKSPHFPAFLQPNNF